MSQEDAKEPGPAPVPQARDPEPNDAAVDRARRRLLKAGLYAAPFIATFGIQQSPAEAQSVPCFPP